MLVKVKELEQSFGIELADDLRTYVLVQLNSANYDLLSNEHLPNLSNNEREFIDSLIKESEDNYSYVFTVDFFNGVNDRVTNFITKIFSDKGQFDELELYVNEHYSNKIKAYNNRKFNEPFLDIFGVKFNYSNWDFGYIKVGYMATYPLFI